MNFARTVVRLRSVLVLVALWSVSITASGSGPSVNELLKLRGNPFFEQEEKLFHEVLDGTAKVSSPELWQILDKLERELRGTDPEETGLQYCLPMWAILRAGSENDRERLQKVCDRLMAHSLPQGAIRGIIADVRIWGEVDSLTKERTRPTVAIPPCNLPVPQRLEGASDDLRNAWGQFASVRLAFEGECKRIGESGAIALGGSTANHAIDDILRGKVEDALPKLIKSEWAGFCGTGAPVFYAEKHRVICLGLIKQQKYLPALGAMLAVNTCGDEIDIRCQQKLAELCGLRWETLCTGAAAESENAYSIYARLLGRSGSVRSAEWVLQLAQLPCTYTFTTIDVSAAFISPAASHKRECMRYGRDVQRSSSEPIPSKVEQQMLHLLCRQMRPEADSREAEELVNVLAALQRPETKETLAKMLTSPFNKVRKKAAETLQALGENVPMPADAPSWRVQILVNGVPLRRHSLDFCFKENAGPGRSVSNQETGHGETDEAGILTLDPDGIVKWRREIVSLKICSSQLESPTAAYVEREIIAPADFKTVSKLEINTAPLVLKITHPRSQAFLKGKTFRVDVTLINDGTRMIGFMDVPATGIMEFPNLQPGRYAIDVQAPAAARWLSGPIDLTKGPVSLNVPLQFATDLRLKLIAPGAKSYDPPPAFRLWKNNDEFGDLQSCDQQGFCRGLPVGKYKMKIPSSKELQARFPNPIPDRLEYLSEEISFVVDEKTPPVLDLGVKRLRLAPPTPPAAATPTP